MSKLSRIGCSEPPPFGRIRTGLNMAPAEAPAPALALPVPLPFRSVAVARAEEGPVEVPPLKLVLRVTRRWFRLLCFCVPLATAAIMLMTWREGVTDIRLLSSRLQGEGQGRRAVGPGNE